MTTPQATNSPLADLSAAGVSLWLDDLSRQRLQSGNLKELIANSNIVGVTTNPSIFQAALKDGASYQKQIGELAARGADVDDTVREVTTDDVRDACDLFTATFETSGHADGRVSIEVDPRLAHDTAATIAQAQELHKIVDRPNLLIKIPATVAGLPAITAVIAEGISVNVTLIFSLDRYKAVMAAYIDGLEQAKEGGHDISQIHSVASFFVSRVDSEIDKRLKAIGSPEAESLEGEAAIANARLAYQAYEQTFAGDRWDALAGGRCEQAAPVVGVHRSQGPQVRRHPLRRGTRCPEHGQHRTGEDHRRGPRSRRHPGQHHRRHLRGGLRSVLRPRSTRHRPRRRLRRPGIRRCREIRAGLERTTRIRQPGARQEVARGPAQPDPRRFNADSAIVTGRHRSADPPIGTTSPAEGHQRFLWLPLQSTHCGIPATSDCLALRVRPGL